MKHRPNRLPADARHGFGGAGIDRGSPLAFRLNGRLYEAFAGDTVLSALLAAGVDAAGTLHGDAVGIDERFAPPVAPARSADDPAAAMPMDRVPVIGELDLVTVGPRRDALRLTGLAARLTNLVVPRSRSLGHRLDDPRAFEGAWLQLPPQRTIEADTVVVGGGLAGMSAALAAAEAGGQVILLERRPMLGGDTRFFGTVGDNDSPDTIIERLSARIAATPSITVLKGTDATGIAGTRLRAHQVKASDGKLESLVVELVARRIVLATGTAERLPVFPGNRMPGVVGAAAAFHRAERYGVWAGERALFATPHNFAYRLALLAADVGIEVHRVVDSRVAPQSRFIDFCKASGITLASGLTPRSIESTRRGSHALSVSFAVALEESIQQPAPLMADLVVAAGGWQPRLALWLMAGGPCAYSMERRWIGADGVLDGVALAGSAAGYRSSAACLASGEQAVAALLGKPAVPVVDQVLDAIYESLDGATPLAPWRTGATRAYLDGGLSFAPRSPPRRADAPAVLTGQLQTLSVADVAASVELGAIAAADAGIIAEERCLGGDIGDSGWRLPRSSPPATTLPAYLAGRFGSRPQLAVVAAADNRFFETGCLLYPNSDAADPLSAIGAVIGPAPNGKPGGIVIANRAAFAAAPVLFVRDTSGAVQAKVVEKLKPPTAEKAS